MWLWPLAKAIHRGRLAAESASIFAGFATRRGGIGAGESLAVVARAQFLEPAARAFSFQARLIGPGIPQDGVVELEISIYDAVGGGNVVSGPHVLPGQPITRAHRSKYGEYLGTWLVAGIEDG